MAVIAIRVVLWTDFYLSVVYHCSYVYLDYCISVFHTIICKLQCDRHIILYLQLEIIAPTVQLKAKVVHTICSLNSQIGIILQLLQ